MWHTTRLMYSNQDSQHSKKHKKPVDGRGFKDQTREKSSWQVKKSEEKEKRRCSD